MWSPDSGPGSGSSPALPLPATRLGYAVVATVGVAGAVLAGLALGVIWIPEGTAETARSLLERYGLAAVFAVFVLEGAMLLVFAPNESVVPLAVLGFADSPADVAAIVGVAVLGATVGQTALFVLARRGGRGFLLERRWIRVGEERLDRFDAWFERWGALAVPATNTMLFVRGMVTVPAGLSGMDLRTFVVLSALGTLVFETLLAGLAVYAPELLATVL
jgi:membrane protein DedA with SNARE-associated domain